MTAGDTPQPPQAEHRRFQFTLGGLMVLVFGVAAGLSAASMETLDWTHALLAAAAAWIVLGLGSQVRDLWGTFHRQSDLSSDERWGYRFAVFWRAGVACLLVGYYVLGALFHLKPIGLPEPDGFFERAAAGLRDAILFLCLMSVLFSVLPARSTEPRGRWPGLLDLAGAAGGVVLCAIVCWDRTCIQSLVAVAIQGIEMAQPLHLAPEGVDVLPAARTARFFRECAIGVGLALMPLGLTYGLARQWSGGLWRRLACGGLLVIALSVSGSYLVWVCAVALPRAFPIMIEAQRLEPLHVWLSAILVVLVFVTMATYRLTRSRVEPGNQVELTRRRAERPYYHERRAVILVLALGVGAQLIATFQFWSRSLLFQPHILGRFLYAFERLLCEGPFLLRFVVFLVAGYAFFSLRHQGSSRRPMSPPRVPASRFFCVWLAMFLASAIGIPTIALFGFAVWFSPWFVGAWP